MKHQFYLGVNGVKCIAGPVVVYVLYVRNPDFTDSVLEAQLALPRKKRNSKVINQALPRLLGVSEEAIGLIPPFELDAKGVKVCIKEQLDALVNQLCVQQSIRLEDVELVLTDQAHPGTEIVRCRRLEYSKLKPPFFSFYAYYLARLQYLEQMNVGHKLFPEYEWNKNKGRQLDSHILKVLDHGPKANWHRAAASKRMALWLYRKMSENYPLTNYQASRLVTVPSWWRTCYYKLPYYHCLSEAQVNQVEYLTKTYIRDRSGRPQFEKLPSRFQEWMRKDAEDMGIEFPL